VLPDLTQPADEEQAPNDIGSVSLRGANGGSTASFCFSIPPMLLSRLDNPKRLIVTGNVHEDSF